MDIQNGNNISLVLIHPQNVGSGMIGLAIPHFPQINTPFIVARFICSVHYSSCIIDTYNIIVRSYNNTTYLWKSSTCCGTSSGHRFSSSNASVSSGKTFHKSQHVFMPRQINLETVSQPVNKWNIGKPGTGYHKLVFDCELFHVPHVSYYRPGNHLA